MAILKYSYLTFGLILYGFMNYLSYTLPEFQGPMNTKILYSALSFVLLMFDEAAILYTHRLFKRPFQSLPLHIKMMLYSGILIIPLISLYYT